MVAPRNGRQVSKRALDVADQIEASVCRLNWQVGTMVGDETALMEQYGVGRSVFRQAIRLSEHLGVASMRRGRTGGLAVSRPGPGPSALSMQIAWSKQRTQHRSAQRLLDAVADWAPTAPRGSKVIHDVVAAAIAGYDATGRVTIRAMDSVKLGEQIAQAILEFLINAQWECDELLGSEAHLMETYNAGRASLREAVHLLELHGVAVMQRGPGGGLLVLQAPSAGALPQSMRAQLRSSGLTDEQTRTLLQELLIALPNDDLQDAALALRLGSRQLLDAL